MRETCAHFTDAADEANFIARPFLVLLAELLCRIFGKIEDLVLLWRAGLIPPPAPKPERTKRIRTRKIRAYARRKRTSRRTPGLRPQRRNSASGPRRFARPRSDAKPSKPAPQRRVDRYPKSAEIT
jgi:hypothetical protein